MVNRGSSIALVSGSGGTGRTTIAINLAASIAGKGARALLFDLCFGWSNLGSLADRHPSFEEILDCDESNFGELIGSTSHGFDLLTCSPPDFIDLDLDDIKRIAWLGNRLMQDYDMVIFDAPSGGHPLALLAAGMSEQVLLFSRPEASSVAGSYCLLKSLYSEGIFSRVKTVFSFVESPEHALSLKTRFDMLTGQFLKIKIADGGFTYRSFENSDDDFSLLEINEGSLALVKNLVLDGDIKFQNETAAIQPPAVSAKSLKQGR